MFIIYIAYVISTAFGIAALPAVIQAKYNCTTNLLHIRKVYTFIKQIYI